MVLTRQIEAAVTELSKGLPAGVQPPQFLFKQADFIENSINNVEEALRDGALMVTLILFMFLLNLPEVAFINVISAVQLVCKLKLWF